ncbi:hypothetical protein MHYP_G00155670 [Metynnis hypsauchen]
MAAEEKPGVKNSTSILPCFLFVERQIRRSSLMNVPEGPQLAHERDDVFNLGHGKQSETATPLQSGMDELRGRANPIRGG